jgi:hypothetical protein
LGTTNGLRPAFGGSPPFVSAAHTAVLGCSCFVAN